MKRTEIVDLIQINDYERNRTGGASYTSLEGGIPTYVAKGIGAEFSVAHNQQKLLERQPTLWEDRLICQHKVTELSQVQLDYVYRYSNDTYYAVDWQHTTSTNHTVSYRVEARKSRDTEYEEDTWFD